MKNPLPSSASTPETAPSASQRTTCTASWACSMDRSASGRPCGRHTRSWKVLTGSPSSVRLVAVPASSGWSVIGIGIITWEARRAGQRVADRPDPRTHRMGATSHGAADTGRNVGDLPVRRLGQTRKHGACRCRAASATSSSLERCTNCCRDRAGGCDRGEQTC